MTDIPQLSGRDLARQALAAYKATARNTPATQANKPRPSVRVHRGERSDPQGLAGILGRLTAEQGWEDNLDGGSIIDQWPTLCPQYVGYVEPAAYDEQRGRLDLRPATHTYAAQLRMFGGQLAAQINGKMGRTVVRTIRVLPVGNLTRSTAPPVDAARKEEPAGLVKTRETASPGYRATLEAALAHKPDRQPTNPYVTEADKRQVAALRANRQPHTEHREAMWTELDATSGPAPGSVEASRLAAIAYKRQDKAGGQTPRAFDVA